MAGAQHSSNNANGSMQGAYTMLSQKINSNGKDSTMDVQQLKIYTDHHFMYAHSLPGDSLGNYGIGRYTMNNGKVTEYSMYTGANGEHMDTFDVSITKNPEGYMQVINFPPDNQGNKFILTETYRNDSKNMKSPLDGAWKMTKVTIYPKDGQPTVVDHPTQYKVYQSGHYMFGATQLDSATKKPVSSYGYGTFTMDGPDKITETATNSTFKSSLVGNPVQLKIAMKGKDQYAQTIVWPDGTKTVEEYERLK
jgi:hypothetical protein